MSFETWKTIVLGTHKDTSHLLKKLNFAGYEVTKFAHDLLQSPAFSLRRKTELLDITIVSVGELGLEDGVSLEHFYDRVPRPWLHLCPAEVGPLLRLQYPRQPHDERLFIGMFPIEDVNKCRAIFSVDCYSDDQYVLDAHPGDLDCPLIAADRFVLACRELPPDDTGRRRRLLPNPFRRFVGIPSLSCTHRM